MPEEELKEGDVVTLKSDSIDMVIERIDRSDQTARCAYWLGAPNKIEHDNFYLAALKKKTK